MIISQLTIIIMLIHHQHIHFRDQRPGKGHLPTWDAQVAADVVAAIRQRCPVLINLTTGTMVRAL
jgi:3-keto-5-aminohexanoate cleavage enzyme